MEFFRKLFESDFMPHGHCYFWRPAVLWTNVLGDGLIALSYFVIPFLLLRFIKKRKDVRFRGIFVAFGVFILACGCTHVIDVISVWHPIYRLEGVVKDLTALASAGTVFMLFHYFPIILAIPNPIQWQKTENSLLASEQRFKTILDNAPIGMSITSAEGHFLEVNGALCKMFGYDRETLLKLKFQDVTHPDDLSASLAMNAPLSSEGEKNYHQIEKRYVRADGSIFWALINLSHMHGEETGNLAQIVDITEQKSHEEKIARENHALEAKIRRRTAELEESKNDLENFINAITHDLRVPLQNVTGLTAVIQEDLNHLPAQSEARQALDMVSENARKVDELVTDLVEFNRAGAKHLHKEPLHMHAKAQLVFDELFPFYKKNKVVFQLQPALPDVTGDRAAIRQVWYNLLSNAFKYSAGREEIHIEVSGWTAGGCAHYRIKDNGIGFDEQYKNKLFTLFQRLHTSEAFEGTGVGLATCYRILKKHGGAIYAEGKVGQGATFTFLLPL